MEVVIAVDDPRVDDVRALLEAHLAFSRAVTPPGHVHALEIDGLLHPAVTFFSARRDGVLVGIEALKRLDDSQAAVKSMDTSEVARRQGAGRATIGELLAVGTGGDL